MIRRVHPQLAAVWVALSFTLTPPARADSLTGRIALEVNETDNQAKVMISADWKGPIRSLKVFSPRGEAVASLVTLQDRLPGFSSISIDGDDASIEVVQENYPPGVYTLEADFLEGGVLTAQTILSHEVLPAPSFSPSDGDEVNPNEVVIRWEPIRGAVGYMVQLERGALDLQWSVGPETHTFAVPSNLLAPGVEYEIDLSTVSSAGNLGVAESSFVTEDNSSLRGHRDYVNQGAGRFFVLEGGYQLVLENEGGRDEQRRVVTVLDETQIVNGVDTRVVEEQVWKNRQLVGVHRRFMAISRRNGDLCCFGEEIDWYDHGRIRNQERNRLGETPRVVIPGCVSPRPGNRNITQAGPGRRVIGLLDSLTTAAGTFRNVLVVFDPGLREGGMEYYAEGIGLVKNDDGELVDYGFIIDDDDDEDDGDDDDDD